MDATNSDPAAGAGFPDGVKQMLIAAMGGNLSALPGLRRFLKENERVWREVGDLGLKAERSWIGLAAGDDLVVREAVDLELRRLTAELAGDGASPIERLLARQAGLAWLEGQYFATLAAQTGRQDLANAHRRFLLDRADRAQAKLAAALKQLALCRRLLAPLPKPAVTAPPPKPAAPAQPVEPAPPPRRGRRRKAPSLAGRLVHK
jgi:hypothetical protein